MPLRLISCAPPDVAIGLDTWVDPEEPEIEVDTSTAMGSAGSLSEGVPVHEMNRVMMSNGIMANVFCMCASPQEQLECGAACKSMKNGLTSDVPVSNFSLSHRMNVRSRKSFLWKNARKHWNYGQSRAFPASF